MWAIRLLLFKPIYIYIRRFRLIFFIRRGKVRACPIMGLYGNIFNHPPFRVHLCVQRKNRFCPDLPFSGVSIWVTSFSDVLHSSWSFFIFPQHGSQYDQTPYRLRSAVEDKIWGFAPPFYSVISLNRIKAVDEECLYPSRRSIQTLFVFGAHLYYVFNYNIVYINIIFISFFICLRRMRTQPRKTGKAAITRLRGAFSL